MIRTSRFRFRDLGTPRAVLALWLPIALVSVLHYSTSASHHWLHDIFRRLYYVPIVLSAFLFGVRGALAASLTASIIYLPHAFTHFTHHDPGRGLEKVLEILLYNVIAVVAGTLADREFDERVRQEEATHQLEETLEEKEEMEQMLIRSGRLQALGELTAGLAHEIRNPLASIRGAAEAIVDEIRETSPRRRMADILLRELGRLEAVVARFLTFAQPVQYDLTRLSLTEVVDGVCELVRARGGADAVDVRWQRGQEAIVVLGSRAEVAQVAMNLILNAAQVSPPGGAVSIRCDRRHRGRRDYGTIVVEDEGPGVPSELREQIFNPFFTTRADGTGLGLTISSRIVDQHHGFIEVSDGARGGARFEVFLPLADPPQTGASGGGSPMEPGPGPG
ncbi:MAG: ATP-binding protein [Candidatus Eiseniibacteriota bacterium]|jgi:signal transduction histidine kinase